MKLNKLLDYYEPSPVPLDEAAQQRILSSAAARLPEAAQRKKRPLRMGLLAAALVALLTGTVVAAVQYSRSVQALAEKWSDAGEIYDEETMMTEEQIAYMEARTVSLAQSVTSEGVTVTLDSVTCMSHDLFLSYGCEMGPDCVLDYDPEDVILRPENWNFYWSNPDYGRIMGQVATVEPGNLEVAAWDSIPNDANLCDGSTAIEIEIRSISVLTANGRNEELAQIEGVWNFTVEIPELEAEPEFTVDAAPLEESFGLTDMTMQITSTGCRLVMPSRYALTNRWSIDENNENPDKAYYVVELYLKDGSKIPDFGAGGCVENDQVEYVVGWMPVNPEELDHVVLFDGETEVTLPIIPSQ